MEPQLQPAAQGDPQQQQKQIEDAISQGANLILLTSADATLVAGGLAAAQAANVPVVLYDHDAVGGKAEAHIGFDSLAVGQAQGPRGGKDLDLTYSAGLWSGPRAFEEAGVTPKDIKYASIYDSFTITVLIQLEDLGFCAKGEGGRFVADGNLIAGVGRLPFNTDGGGLCNNHPTNRGGITKVIEAVRQLRGEAHPAVQVPACDLAVATGIGGSLGVRHGAATVIMERQ